MNIVLRYRHPIQVPQREGPLFVYSAFAEYNGCLCRNCVAHTHKIYKGEKTMSKKIIAALLALAMVIGLAACGNGGNTSSTAEESSKTESSTAESSTDAGEANTDEGTTIDATGAWIPAAEHEDDAIPGENDDRAFKKFENTVEITFGQQVDPVDTTLPEGDAVDNNQYTRYLEENYNIKYVCEWTAGNTSDFQQKLSLAIASASLPNSVIAPNRNYLVQAARADLLADLWPAFNGYDSKQVKEIVETTGTDGDYRAISNCTVDGVFCALPNITVDTDGVYIYFIRQDWLDELNIEAPKTYSELKAAAKAFMESGKSPDYAIAGIDNGGRTYSNFLQSSNNGYGFDALYQAFNATPGYFLRDDAGKIYWGTTTDEMKAAVAELAEWYKEGLINPEIGVTTNGDNANGVKNCTCGIFMGPWWSLGYGNGDSFKNDPTADWQAYPLYTNDGEWNIHMKDVGTTYTMLSKDCTAEQLEAAVVANNILVRDESIFDTSVAIGWYPQRNVIAAADECEYEYDALMGILKGEATVEDYQIGGAKYTTLYKNLANDAATLSEVISEDYDPSKELHVTDMDVMTNNGQFNRFYALLVGDRPYATIEPDKKIYSEVYYTLDGMDQYWTQVSDLEDQTILQMITGKKSIDEWDQFCADWHAQGGDKILEIVEEFLAG